MNNWRTPTFYLFFAAREGHALSARAPGEMYDPSYHSAKPSIIDESYYAQAYKWYRKAADAGDLITQELLNKLRVVVEEAARRGDQDAKLLLVSVTETGSTNDHLT